MAEFETVRISNVDQIADEPSSAPITIVLHHSSGATTYPLSDGASVEIGRMPPCQVVLPDESVSKRHVKVRLLQGQLFVTDLNSLNGTRVGDRPIVDETAVSTGDIVMLGSVAMRFSTAPGALKDESRLEGYDQFRQHVEDEIVRSKHFRRSAAVLAVRVQTGGPIVAAASRVATALKPIDRVALYSSEVLLVLLPETNEEDRKKLIDEIGKREAKPRLLVGAAMYAESGSTADELIDVSRAMLRRTTSEMPLQLAQKGARTLLPSDVAAGRVVKSPSMIALYEQVARVRAQAFPVLLRGETGTGKEVIARAVHEGGPREKKPLRVLNCGAITASLIESELFGHEKGAFTGADKQHIGVFESAEGGTVFLDEIGELPLEAQAKLLRVLHEKKIKRVGNTTEIAVDFRVVAASHRNLDEMVAKGTFREDLLYRLNVMELEIPPLRARREEIEPLAEKFLAEAAAFSNRAAPTLSQEVVDLIAAYPWPGNVRELKNAMERAAAISTGDVIVVSDLPDRVRRFASPSPSPSSSSTAVGIAAFNPAAAGGDGGDDEVCDLAAIVRGFEKKVIEDMLVATNGNQTVAARRLSLPLRTLVDKIKKLGVSKGKPETA